MIVPTSTYRIQFRNGMTFDRVVKAVPCLRDLGVSHLYASPIFTAVKGSSHGYDVTNCNEIDPDLGGRQGFERLSEALKHEGMGLILDVVPNHMAASVENPWWTHVLKFGGSSRYSNYFDIDWSERLTLPVLGKAFDQALADGEIVLRPDQSTSEWHLAYFDTLLPLNPASVTSVADPADPREIANVHNAQAWRLIHWKDAASHLSYRRFFEVTGLVGLRVEEDDVFDASHALILDLVRSRQVQGLRLDHIDGLTDPTSYLRRLRKKIGPDVFLVVEKILGKAETLPFDWPVQGTTGYEFITALSNLFIEPEGAGAIGESYASIAGASSNYRQGLREAKSLMVEQNFRGETRRLIRLARSSRTDLSEDEIGKAIKEILVAFPVYRTYGQQGALDQQDAAVLQRVLVEAAQHLEHHDALDWIGSVLLDGSQPEFRARLQQLSGPIMAKAVEDTLFYRFNRLLAANEVGGDPGSDPGGIEAFHELMMERQKRQPTGLSATSTHDTKRGEDARALLYTLSEDPDDWTAAVARWRSLNARYLTDLSGRTVPEPDVEWMLYQALAGMWPGNGPDAENTTRRFTEYVEKAVREAKLATSWTNVDEAYENAVKAYAAALVSTENASFRRDLIETIGPFVAAGAVNSLSQTLIKLTAPGIPDIYQGSEASDFSLVDPDNRRRVDFERLSRTARGGREERGDDFQRRKHQMIRTVLHLRRNHPDLFEEGSYLPILAKGRRERNVVAYARCLGSLTLIVVASRIMLGDITTGTFSAGAGFWENTVLESPSINGPFTELLTGREVHQDSLGLGELLGHEPVALLMTRR
ncbi:malto-oligosyltrehalose synthase [Rhizobium grahamii]|uniref:Malto-oligosyltrehalose synthase n=1 Tax=Rhizobium grahamii CCGE 502 TaxID=990285 RepID=S3IBS2_9HYPH|nr:malto-oligosyltrehalose synthase [Rhizobium grahamii]EPE96653.1 malto-oligosyltrehalose synthase [Rhizobium grahamii CCGE 502]